MGGGLGMGRACIEPSKPSSSSLSSAVTASTSITETVNGEYDFRISGYSLAKGSGIGKYIASDTFTVGGYSWAIYFYPDGKSTEDNASHVSLFIALASDGYDVRALFELTLIDQSGNERHKVRSHFGRALESGPYTLKYRGSMWGYKRFFRISALETSDYLKDDCLQVHCCVGVVRSHTEGPRSYSIHIPPSDIHSLPERVRREKINERMKFLQDLVPGCNKVTGKAVMLDEIINYVQSLQRQVEFLSMKLATVNPRTDMNIESLLSKDPASMLNTMNHLEAPSQPFYGLVHDGSHNPLTSMMHRGSNMKSSQTDGFGDASAFWENDLQSVVQMGFGQNQGSIFQGLMGAGQMKVEL